MLKRWLIVVKKMTKNSLEGQKSMESDDYYVYLQPIYNIIMAETLLLTSAMRHPAGERKLTILEIRRCLSVKNHPFFFYFIEFIYLCHRFHILHPRCTQGVPKV